MSRYVLLIQSNILIMTLPIEVKLRSLEGPVVGLPVLVNTKSKVNLLTLNALAPFHSRGCIRFVSFIAACSRMIRRFVSNRRVVMIR